MNSEFFNLYVLWLRHKIKLDKKDEIYYMVVDLGNGKVKITLGSCSYDEILIKYGMFK